MKPGAHRRHRVRARARHLRRLGDDRPHLARRLDQADLPGRPLSAGTRRIGAEFQQLRRAPRQPRGHAARHVRQRADQEPDGAARSRTARACEGGVTLFQPSGERMSIYDAAMRYQNDRRADDRVRRRGIRHRQLARLGRQRHAAPGRQGGDRQELRAHPSLEPRRAWACCRCSSRAAIRVESLGISGDETFDIAVPANIKPQQELTLAITRKDGSKKACSVLCRIDTPIEVDYYKHGGILPFVLRELIAA